MWWGMNEEWVSMYVHGNMKNGDRKREMIRDECKNEIEKNTAKNGMGIYLLDIQLKV